jgi:hypothetical protein
MSRELERQLNVKFDQRIYAKVEKIGKRLDLRVSEIVRRAVAAGLKEFNDARLPGSETVSQFGRG